MATILVVDDRPTNREFLTTLLGYGGHRLLEAADGAEALGLAKKERPDLVISDILMPTMDGYELVRQLRAEPALAQTAVIFYTAHYREEEARALARACAVCCVLTKPAEPTAILSAVEAALGTAPLPLSPVPAEEFDREHLRLMTDKLAQKANELKRSHERLSAMVDLGLQLGSELDLRRLLQSFGHAAREIIGARYVITAILDHQGPGLRYLFTSGMDADTAARLGSPDPKAEVLQAVLREGRCVRLQNPGGAAADIGLSSSYPPIRALLAAPIESPTRIYGWLGLIDKVGADSFSDEDERLADILAAQVGRIYQNGSLYADVMSHAAELEREVGERKRADERQAILLAVSQALVDASTLREGARRVLEAICTRLSWELGAVWMVDRAANVLRCLEVWHGAADTYAPWKERTGSLTLAAGEGLPGRVWLQGKPDWIADVSKEANFPRTADAGLLGLHAGFAFPVLGADQVRGVVELFSPRFREPDNDLLQMFTGISGPLGQFMERKLGEEALRESEAQIRLLLDSAGEGIYGIDLQGNCTFANRACGRLLGYKDAGYLLGKNTHEIMHHTHADGTPYPVNECRIFQAFRRGEGTHVDDEVLWRADGTSFPAEYWSFPIRRDDQVVGSVVTFLDISARRLAGDEQRKLTEQVHRTQERLQHVISSSPAVLYTLAIEGANLLPTWMSDNVKEMMGYGPDEVYRPKWWDERVHPDDIEGAWALIRQKLFLEGRLAHEHRFRHKDGSYRWVHSEMRLLRDQAGQAVEVVGSWSDITERKQLEEQFRQAQKMEAVGRLAGGIAHDFNNLLTVIIGYSDFFLAKLRPEDPLRPPLTEIHKAGERAAGLTRQLLAFSRKQVLRPVVLDLNAIMVEMEKMLHRLIGEDITLTVVPGPALWKVKADPGQMEQVAMNIVVNSRDAMPQGGKLLVETKNVRLDDNYAQAHAEANAGEYVLLAISDSGGGMDASVRARIFEPFFTTKGPTKGTGLGLATVFGIVKQSGGHIEVYSEVGHGTTFKIYLPRDNSGEPIASASRTKDPVRGGKETLLLVEDEDGVRAFARTALEEQGYTLIDAKHGGDALMICETRSGPIDLMITDVVMPYFSGRQLAERLAPMQPAMKVLFMSGYTDDAIIHHGVLESGMPFLQKPFAPEVLIRKVREVLDALPRAAQRGKGENVN